MVVLQLLHEAYLCLLLYWLVGWSVLADTESVVGPDELDGEFHKCRHAHCWLHIVREDEECAAGGDDTAVESHTDAAACHGELCNTSLEEGTAEIATYDVVGLLEESIGLI